MGMINPVDAKLSLGEAAYSDSALPDILSLNQGQVERMKVELVVGTAFAGGTSVTFTVYGGDSSDAVSTELSTVTATTAELAKGSSVSVPIPAGKNPKFLKVGFSKTGNFTAGKVTGYLDTYLGI